MPANNNTENTKRQQPCVVYSHRRLELCLCRSCHAVEVFTGALLTRTQAESRVQGFGGRGVAFNLDAHGKARTLKWPLDLRSIGTHEEEEAKEASMSASVWGVCQKFVLARIQLPQTGTARIEVGVVGHA